MIASRPVSAQEIHVLRDDLGLTQAQLGQLVGAHSMTVSKWERGVENLSPSDYQTELLRSFQQAARDPKVRRALRDVLIGMGVPAAILLLLKAWDE